MMNAAKAGNRRMRVSTLAATLVLTGGVAACSSSGKDPASAVSPSAALDARRDSGGTLLPFPIRPDPLEARRHAPTCATAEHT